jgi:FixJ family two-component response regulator
MNQIVRAFKLGLMGLTEKERKALQTALQCKGNKSAAARELGLAESTLAERHGRAVLKLRATMQRQGTWDLMIECVRDSSMTVAACLEQALMSVP